MHQISGFEVTVQCLLLLLQNGRIEYSWLLRHVEPSLCPVGSIFIYLFARFQGCEAPLPDLSDRRLW